MHYRLSALLVGLLVALGGSAGAQQQTGPYIQVSPTPSKLSVGGPGFVQVDANGIASVVAQAPGSGTVTNTGGALNANSMVVGNSGADIKTIAGSIGGAFTTSGPFTTTGAASGVTFALPANGPFTFTFPPASQTLSSLAGAETFTNKIYNGGQLSGTFSGNPTFSGIPLFTNLLPGTQVACLGLDSGFHLVTLAASCGAGGGTTFANPTATASDVAVNGSATTAMRSDAAPAVQKATNAVFGLAKGDGTTLTCVAGVCSSLTGGAGTVTQNGNLTTNALLIGGTNGTTDAKADTHVTENGTQTTINYNTAALSSVTGGAQLQIGAADTAQARVALDTFGSVFGSAIAMRGARGTAASKTALQATDILGTFAGWGYGATGYSSANRAAIAITATENWSDTAQGTKITIGTTANTTTTTTNKLSVENDGGLLASIDVVASPPTGGSKGAGTVNVSSGYYVNGTLLSGGTGFGVDGGTSAQSVTGTTTINTTAREVEQTTIAAAEVLTLPPITSFGNHNCFRYHDVSNAISATFTVTFTANANDKFVGGSNGGSSPAFVTPGMSSLICAIALSGSNGTWQIGLGTIAAAGPVVNQWVSQIESNGKVDLTQPGFSNISGTATPAQVGASAASHAVPVDVAGTTTWKVVPDCTDTGGNHINFTQSTDAFSCGTSSSGGGGSSVASIPQGRLTLQTGVPVMRSDQTAKTTIYYDAYAGNLYPNWNGSAMANVTITSDEISMGLDAVTPHIASGSLYDVFGTSGAALCAGPAWSSTSSRGTGAGTTELQLKNGVWTNKNSLTNCWGGASGTTNLGAIAANQGTYLGTIYATANGQTGMAYNPAGAAGGSNAILGLCNGYNQVAATSVSRDTTSTWTYSTATWRSANNSNSNRISWVDCLGNIAVSARHMVVGSGGGSGNGAIGVDFDSTSANPGGFSGYIDIANMDAIAEDSTPPLLGLRFVQAVEYGRSATTTFNGASLTNIQLQGLFYRGMQ